ncbi:MAG: restriction endonuclease subunit S [Candidatus Omnitrophota bacterium]|jgi:type I restriction enzyme S subunit|nr:MAG: restriction endonuclease subunit S [Candidatus Omnitrophota bacterium]
MENNLPDGWDELPLSEVADARMGETILAKDLTGSGIPVYSAGMDNTPWGFLEKPKKIHAKGTIVVSARGSIGFPKIPKNDRFASTQTTIALKLRDEALTDYCCLWLKTINWRELTKGGAIPMLTVGDINKLVMPLPTPIEREKILSKLKALLPKVKDAQSRLDTIPVILNRFRQSVLAAAFSGELTKTWKKKEDEEEWREVRLGEVLNDLKYGTAKKCFKEKKKHPVLRIPNVVQGYIDLDDLKYADLDKKEYESLKLEPGDILLIRSNGSVSLVGRTALVTDKEESMAYAGYLIRLRVNKELILPEFLQYQFQSYAMRLQIELPARSTSGVNNINSEEVKNLQISLPPIDEQEEIVKRLKSSFAFIEKNENEFNKAKGYTDKLEQSILAKAFRGELVR